MAADGNRVGAHMGQLHIPKKETVDTWRQTRLNYFTYDDSS
jgi:hypothetical protein